MNNRIPHLALFIAVSLAAIALGFVLFSPETTKSLFKTFGYANVGLLVAALLFVSWKDSADFIKRNWKKREVFLAVAGCVAAAGFLYTREGGGFKIMFDEQVLSNVALSLHKDHDPAIRESSLMGVAHYEKIDKRPLLFPFVLSLAHNLTGYRVDNAFLLNFALTATFLALLFSCLQRIANRTTAIIACLLACSMPLIEQNSSGGGFEMLNLCAALLCVWLAMNYWEQASEHNLSKLVLAAALASHVRYESAIIIIPIAGLIVASWIREKRIILSYTLILIPLSFLTLAWQLRYINSQSIYWQYNLEGDASFSLSYFRENLIHAFRFFAIPDTMYAGSPFVGLIGIAGFLALLGFSLTRKEKLYAGRPDRAAAAIVSTALLIQFGLVLCFTFGQLDIAIVSRLGLPFVLILIASGGILLAHIYAHAKAGKPMTIIFLVLAGLYAFSMYSKAEYTIKSGINERIDSYIEFAETKRNENSLFITTTPRPFEIEGFNNLSTQRAKQVLEKLKRHLDILTYDNIYLIEQGIIEIQNGIVSKSIIPETSLGEGVVLETEMERSTIEHNFFRISRIASIDLTATTPATEQANPVRFKELTPEEYKEWRLSLP